MMFATMGKEMHPNLLGGLISDFSEQRLGCRNIGINAHRHGVIEMQWHLIPSAADTITQALPVVDAQAGHSSDTAAMNYSIDTHEHHRYLSHTVAKFILVSTPWWPIILPMQ
jgi:hypothetical protein